MTRVKYQGKFYVRMDEFLRLNSNPSAENCTSILGYSMVEIPEEVTDSITSYQCVDLDAFMREIKRTTKKVLPKDIGKDVVCYFADKNDAKVITDISGEEFTLVPYTSIEGTTYNKRFTFPIISLYSIFVVAYVHFTERKFPKEVLLK